MVTRGGFHVGNGINWKGQIFSKTSNYTMTNRMTVCKELFDIIRLSLSYDNKDDQKKCDYGLGRGDI